MAARSGTAAARRDDFAVRVVRYDTDSAGSGHRRGTEASSNRAGSHRRTGACLSGHYCSIECCFGCGHFGCTGFGRDSASLPSPAVT